MTTRNIVNRLAYLAALIVLIGVTGAASSVFAAETADSMSSAEQHDARRETIVGAREAMTEAAAAAAAALKAETAFDLDNQLRDITSTLIAAAD